MSELYQTGMCVVIKKNSKVSRLLQLMNKAKLM